MNSIRSISHHLFVSAAGHENRPQSRAERSPSQPKDAIRRVMPAERPAKSLEEADRARQLELLAGMVGAG